MEDYKVLMRYDGVETVGEAWKSAFDIVWAPKGWTLVDHVSEVISRELGETVDDASKLRKEQLVQVAPAFGVSLDGSETKDEILTRLEQTKES